MSKIINIIEAKKKPKEINFVLKTSDKQAQAEFIQTLGYIPFVWFQEANLDLRPESIINFELLIHENIPMLKIRFRDVFNILKENKFPKDDSKCSVFINSRSQLVKSIFMDFKIIKFVVEDSDRIYCEGVLDFNQLYEKDFKSYSDSTSLEVMRKIATEVGLGLNSNINSTLDTMSWINPGLRLIDFMKSVWAHSYVSESSFIYGFIDWYYNINIIDVEKELKRPIDNQQGSANTGFEKFANSPESESVGPIKLTNDVSMVNSNVYFDKWELKNQSTAISIRDGYSTDLKFYERIEKNVASFIITPNFDNSKISLRGQVGDNEFVDKNIKYKFGGKLDSDNVHKNYIYAESHNNKNLMNLQKLVLELFLTTPNFNLHPFMKVTVLFSNQTQGLTYEHINYRLSGEWIITDIRIIYESIRVPAKGKYQDTPMRQVVRLIKRELELSKTEASTQGTIN